MKGAGEAGVSLENLRAPRDLTEAGPVPGRFLGTRAAGQRSSASRHPGPSTPRSSGLRAPAKEHLPVWDLPGHPCGSTVPMPILPGLGWPTKACGANGLAGCPVSLIPARVPSRHHTLLLGWPAAADPADILTCRPVGQSGVPVPDYPSANIRSPQRPRSVPGAAFQKVEKSLPSVARRPFLGPPGRGPIVILCSPGLPYTPQGISFLQGPTPCHQHPGVRWILGPKRGAAPAAPDSA